MNPEKLIITALLLASTLVTYAQRNKKTDEAFYSFDENWKNVSAEQSKYFIRRTKVSDTCWQWDTYNLFGPMIRSEQCIDEKGSLQHGRYAVFNKEGKLDSLCYFSKGVPNGKWYIFNDPFYNIVYTYKLGELVDTKKTVKVKGGSQAKDSVKTNEKESEYPGGIASWQRYMNTHLRYPQRAINARIMGFVTVGFTIDTIGNVGDCFIYRSVEYSLDEESLRIIRDSRRWNPAQKEGVAVTSYKRQPIGFKLPN